MHIVIPMSGIGKRFLDQGYEKPKPLIEIGGKHIINHVCDLFPGEEKFTFICNSKHLDETNMKKILLELKPKANIVEIPNHKKGPVYAVSLANDLIDDDEEVMFIPVMLAMRACMKSKVVMMVIPRWKTTTTAVMVVWMMV